MLKLQLLAIGAWVMCGVLAAGIVFAYFDDGSDDWRDDLGQALGMGLLCGPIGLLIAFFLSGFCRKGWRLWPRKGELP